MVSAYMRQLVFPWGIPLLSIQDEMCSVVDFSPGKWHLSQNACAASFWVYFIYILGVYVQFEYFA